MESEAPELIGQLPFLSGRRSDGVAQVNVVMFVAKVLLLIHAARSA